MEQIQINGGKVEDCALQGDFIQAKLGMLDSLCQFNELLKAWSHRGNIPFSHPLLSINPWAITNEQDARTQVFSIMLRYKQYQEVLASAVEILCAIDENILDSLKQLEAEDEITFNKRLAASIELFQEDDKKLFIELQNKIAIYNSDEKNNITEDMWQQCVQVLSKKASQMQTSLQKSVNKHSQKVGKNNDAILEESKVSNQQRQKQHQKSGTNKHPHNAVQNEHMESRLELYIAKRKQRIQDKEEERAIAAEEAEAQAASSGLKMQQLALLHSAFITQQSAQEQKQGAGPEFDSGFTLALSNISEKLAPNSFYLKNLQELTFNTVVKSAFIDILKRQKILQQHYAMYFKSTRDVVDCTAEEYKYLVSRTYELQNNFYNIKCKKKHSLSLSKEEINDKAQISDFLITLREEMQLKIGDYIKNKIGDTSSSSWQDFLLALTDSSIEEAKKGKGVKGRYKKFNAILAQKLQQDCQKDLEEFDELNIFLFNCQKKDEKALIISSQYIMQIMLEDGNNQVCCIMQKITEQYLLLETAIVQFLLIRKDVDKNAEQSLMNGMLDFFIDMTDARGDITKNDSEKSKLFDPCRQRVNEVIELIEGKDTHGTNCLSGIKEYLSDLIIKFKEKQQHNKQQFRLELDAYKIALKMHIQIYGPLKRKASKDEKLKYKIEILHTMVQLILQPYHDAWLRDRAESDVREGAGAGVGGAGRAYTSSK